MKTLIHALFFSMLFQTGMEPVETAYIAVPFAELHDTPGSKGKIIATLEEGLKIYSYKIQKSGFIKIKVRFPFEIEGWIKKNQTGCRITIDTQIKIKPDSEEYPPGSPIIRKGGLVRILREKGNWIQVETSPYRVRIYSVINEKTGETIAENIYTGYILNGWIPRENCKTDEEDMYFDSLPETGTLKAFKEDSKIYFEKPEEPFQSKKNQKIQLEGKALKNCRWVELQQEGQWSRGYTDGTVVIKGWAPVDILGQLPNTNPLNEIFIKRIKDYELIAETEIKTTDGKKNIAKLPAGTYVFKSGVDYEGCIIKTPPPIIIEGLVSCRYLKSMSELPEKVIEETGKKTINLFPERGPKDRVKKGKKK